MVKLDLGYLGLDLGLCLAGSSREGGERGAAAGEGCSLRRNSSQTRESKERGNPAGRAIELRRAEDKKAPESRADNLVRLQGSRAGAGSRRSRSFVQ